MFSLKLQGRVIICCIFQANCFLRQTFFFMKKHSPLLNVKWSFPMEYQCPYWLKTWFKYELSELHDTTGTINVAKYIYPSGTPGVTDCFLSCYARFSSFVFFVSFCCCCTIVVLFTRLFSGVLLTVRLRSMILRPFLPILTSTISRHYQSLWFHRSVYFYMSGIFLTKLNLVFAI